MSKVLQNLIVIAKHGSQFIDACLVSLGDKYPTVVMDTSEGGHPSWAYIQAYKRHKADNYLFIQDSMTALTTDVIQPFQEKMPVLGAVAWGLFHYAYDDTNQEEWVSKQYNSTPQYGIFGPVFYTNRQSLGLLDKKGLLPLKPEDKLQAQGTERAWACAFQDAGLSVESLSMWDKDRMEAGSYPVFRKIFGGRT